MQMISIIFSAELTSKASGRQNKPEGKDSVQNTEALSRRDSSGNGIKPDSWMLHAMVLKFNPCATMKLNNFFGMFLGCFLAYQM